MLKPENTRPGHVNSLIAAVFISAFLFIQCYISGTRLAFSLPAYALIGIAGAATLLGRPARVSTPNRACLAATAVCFAYMVARAAFSPVEYLARADLYMMLACLVVYGLTTRHFTSSNLRLLLLSCMCFLAVAEVLIGVWQFSHSDDWMPFGLVRNPSETRASGMFISSIHFAGYLEAIGPFALAITTWGTRNPAIRLLSGAVAALCYFGVLISGSRGGWLSSLLSLAVFAGISLRLIVKTDRQRLPAFLYAGLMTLIAAGIGIVALMSGSEMLQTRMDLVSRITAVTSGDPKAGPYDVRVYNWMAALDQWRLAPVLGTGAGTHLYYGRQFRRPQLQTDPEHAHGDYLELLAEYGIIGAIGMAAFLATHLLQGVRTFRFLEKRRAENPYRSSDDLAIHIGALTAISAYLAHSVVDFNLHIPGNALLFAFIFGVIAVRPTESERYAEPDGMREPRFTIGAIALTALGVLLAWIAITKLPGEYWCEKTRVASRDLAVGDVTSSDHRFADAIEFGTRALHYERKNPYIYYYLGQAYRIRAASRPRGSQTADLRAAESAYESGLALFPQDEDLWIRLGQTLDALGNYQKARSAYLKAIELDPNLSFAHAYFAKHLFRVGREAEAEAALARAKEYADKKVHEFLSTFTEHRGKEPEN